MLDTCDKCFKDVQVNENGCCPFCGQNIARMKAAKPAEWKEPNRDFSSDLELHKRPLMMLAVLLGVALIFRFIN